MAGGLGEKEGQGSRFLGLIGFLEVLKRFQVVVGGGGSIVNIRVFHREDSAYTG